MPVTEAEVKCRPNCCNHTFVHKHTQREMRTELRQDRSREFNIFKEFDSVYSKNKAQKNSFSSCFVASAKIYLNLNMKQVNRNDKNKTI